MDLQVQRNNVPWMDENDEWGSTIPSTLVAEEGDATVLVAVVIGVVVAIILLFTLALTIDCRNQKTDLSGNSSIVQKVTTLPRIPQFVNNSAVNSESISFANQMCTANSMTLPPVLGEQNMC